MAVAVSEFVTAFGWTAVAFAVLEPDFASFLAAGFSFFTLSAALAGSSFRYRSKASLNAAEICGMISRTPASLTATIGAKSWVRMLTMHLREPEFSGSI